MDALLYSVLHLITRQFIQTVDDDICEGAVGQQAPTIAYDLRKISPFGHTSTKLCSALLGLCQPPSVNQWSVPFPKPSPIAPKKFVSTGKAPFQVVHFSDTHVDRQYTVSPHGTT